jgi:hypothetical protein
MKVRPTSVDSRPQGRDPDDGDRLVRAPDEPQVRGAVFTWRHATTESPPGYRPSGQAAPPRDCPVVRERRSPPPNRCRRYASPSFESGRHRSLALLEDRGGHRECEPRDPRRDLHGAGCRYQRPTLSGNGTSSDRSAPGAHDRNAAAIALRRLEASRRGPGVSTDTRRDRRRARTTPGTALCRDRGLLRASAARATDPLVADKAASIGSSDLVGPRPDFTASRLLVLRSTTATRQLARDFEATLRAAYPARTADVLAALRNRADWPGPGIVWIRIEGDRVEVLDGPPRGVPLGR